MIPIFKPKFTNSEIANIKKVLGSSWVGSGSKTKEFEEKFSEYITTKYSVGVNSATSGLHIALKVIGISNGDEVITTPMTFISTNMSILYNNATPVFCDVEEDSLNIDSNKIEPLITSKTKAIIVVHYGGFSCNMDKIMQIAVKYDLKVIEDCAHACGGSYNDKKLGSIGDISVFSFNAVKNLSTGDGGMICLNDRDKYERLLKLRWLGITKDTFQRNDKYSYDWEYDISEFGYKYQMTDITASIGLVQLENLDYNNRKRKLLVDRYNKAFECIDWIKTPASSPQCNPSYHNYVIQVDNRNELHCYLKNKKIATGVHYKPNNQYSLFKNYRSKTPIADKVFNRILTLPLFIDLSSFEQDYIIKSILEFKK